MSWAWLKIITGIFFVILPGFSLKSNFKKRPILTILSLLLGLFILFLSLKPLFVSDSNIEKIESQLSEIKDKIEIESPIKPVDRNQKKILEDRYSKWVEILKEMRKNKKNNKTIGFYPKKPNFPHGKGITRGKKDSICNSNTSTCPRGLPFPSFNNYIDSGQGEGINDERKFLVVQNITDNPGGTTMKNIVDAKPGDYIYLRAYIHNNGDIETVANDVHLGLEGFKQVGKGIYQSYSGKKIKLRLFISSENTDPKIVSDDAYINSSTGEGIMLEYMNSVGPIKLTNNTPINPSNFFDHEGMNIGDIKGADDYNPPFYLQMTFRVKDSIEYDVNITKTAPDKVAKDEIVNYRVFYSSLPKYTAKASQIIIFDDYDQSKISIIAKPEFCKDNGDILICQVADLTPNNGRYYYYTATIKKGSNGDINSLIGISTYPDKDINLKNNTAVNKILIKQSN